MFTHESLRNSVIIDTETTGLDDKAQIVEISVICAFSGDVLFNSLVNPRGWIPENATQIHGIGNADVVNSPSFLDVLMPLNKAIGNKQILIYNADYDTRVFHQSYALNTQMTSKQIRSTFSDLLQKFHISQCVMCLYADHYKQWSDTNQGYKWQSLTNACKQQNVDVSDLTAHRALADCEMTRRLIHKVWLPNGFDHPHKDISRGVNYV